MKILIPVIVAVVMASVATSAKALPFNMADNNPQVVSYYPQGVHGIVGSPFYHEGEDLVKMNGNSKSFQQWFCGTSAEEGEHCHHSVWKVQKDNVPECPANWIPIYSDHQNPNNFWGDHTEDDTWYCVMTNEFKTSK